VKFGFTMASTTTILAWGYLSYKDAYEEVSKYNVFVFLQNILIPTLYFVNKLPSKILFRYNNINNII